MCGGFFLRSHNKSRKPRGEKTHEGGKEEGPRQVEPGPKMKNSRKNDVEIITAEGETDPPPRWVSLNSLHDVRREMASVYRQAKAGRMDVQEATRLTYILSNIAKVIETSDVAMRLELLETILKERRALQ